MITATCTCGHSLRLRNDGAGREIVCPECGLAFTAPGLEAAIESLGPGVNSLAVRGLERKVLRGVLYCLLGVCVLGVFAGSTPERAMLFTVISLVGLACSAPD